MVKGNRYGALTVVRYLGKNVHKKDIWKCKCDCGKVIRVAQPHYMKSCGCLPKPFNVRKYLHTKLYSAIGRCDDLECKRYGGRGIDVCQEWRDDPDSFVQWSLENGWEPGLQIDRRDNDGDYTPDNCRYVTPKANCRNKSNNKLLTYNGKTQCIAAWNEELGSDLLVECEGITMRRSEWREYLGLEEYHLFRDRGFKPRKKIL